MLSDIKTRHGFVLWVVGISFNLSSCNWSRGYDFLCPIDSAMNLNVKILHVTQINPKFLKSNKSHYFHNTNPTKLLLCSRGQSKRAKEGHFLSC